MNTSRRCIRCGITQRDVIRTRVKCPLNEKYSGWHSYEKEKETRGGNRRPSPPREWMIWDHLNQMYWKPHGKGLTVHIENAGKFTEEEARDIIHRPNGHESMMRINYDNPPII